MNCFGSPFRLALLVVVSTLIGLGGTALAATKQPGYPVPHVTAPTVPTAVAPGGPGFTLKVYGANFINGSVVNWNKQARTTTFVSGHELDAQILASDIATNTAGLITVTTTSPGGQISSSTFAQVEVHAPITTVTFGSPQTILPFGCPVLLTDLDGDENLDLAINNFAGSGYQLQSLINNGSGVFSYGPDATRNYFGSGDAEFGDFNGDGNQDIVFVQGNSFNSNTSHLQVNLGNGDATFRPGSHFGSFPFPPTQILVGDFNQDGILDVAVNTGAVLLYFGNGDGTFTRGTSTSVGGGSGPHLMLTGDFNGDGKLDLLVAVNSGSNFQLRVLFGNGDGTFRSPRTVASFTGFNGFPPLVLTDLNGDGIPDLLYNDNSQMTVLIGRGDGTFKNLGALADLTDGLAVGDFNSDGNVDLLFWSGGFNAFLRFGNGDGTFGPDQSLSLSLGAGTISADFNNDGLRDVAEGNIYLQQ